MLAKSAAMLGVGRGTVVLGLAGLLAGGVPGCLFWDCDDSFHGVSDGDHFTSTILGPYTEREATYSCGEVGDLLPGTTLTWIAHPDGPGDGCDDQLDMEVTAREPGNVRGDEFTLANGCTATWHLTAHPLADDTDFLANDLESPRWYIQRHMSNLSAECAPDGKPPSTCTDYFIASSTR
jgi:hypothetical protein